MSWEVLKNKEVTAKRRHICEWCGRAINPDERYLYRFVIQEGDAFSFRTHTYCDALTHKLDMFYDNEDGIDGDLFCQYVDEAYRYLIKVDPIHKVCDEWKDKIKSVARAYGIKT